MKILLKLILFFAIVSCESLITKDTEKAQKYAEAYFDSLIVNPNSAYEMTRNIPYTDFRNLYSKADSMHGKPISYKKIKEEFQVVDNPLNKNIHMYFFAYNVISKRDTILVNILLVQNNESLKIYALNENYETSIGEWDPGSKLNWFY